MHQPSALILLFSILSKEILIATWTCGNNYLFIYLLHGAEYFLRSVFQLVREFPAFYGTRKFITTFTSVRHLSLSSASSIQSMSPTSHVLKIHLNIILPSKLGSSKWSLSLRFPHQKPLYASPLAPKCYMSRPSHSSLFDLPNNIVV
jgi:hypothetical protein